MPDMQTALTEALKKTAAAWAADDEAHQKIEPKQEQPLTATNPTELHITSNVSRITFNFVRGNPGLTQVQVADRLEMQGFKPASVTSLLSQMRRAGMILTSENGGLTTAQEAYTPISVAALRHSRDADNSVRRRKRVELVSTRTGEVFNLPNPHPARPAVPEFDTQALLNSWSIVQARAVYDALKEVFNA
jgi:hypothetical protein